MQSKQGIPVSPGVAICPAVVVDAEDQPVPHRQVAAHLVEHEVQRFNDAVIASTTEIESFANRPPRAWGRNWLIFFLFMRECWPTSL